jgi:Tol biopolymer transport system component
VNASPDGKWTAEGLVKTNTGIIVGDNELYYVQLKVVSADQSTQWILVDSISNFGLGYTTPQILHWSPDGRYLYFTNRPHVDGCGLFVTASDLWQVDLADGEITQVFSEGAQSYSFSPDGNQLAMLTWSTPPELVIHELSSGEQSAVSLDFDDAGVMVWSPDGNAIAMTVANKPCLPGWTQGILLLDVDTLTPTVILEPDERLLQTNDWPETGKIILEDREHALYWLETSSGELESIQ